MNGFFELRACTFILSIGSGLCRIAYSAVNSKLTACTSKATATRFTCLITSYGRLLKGVLE
jgi:hypothetical protein